MSMLLEAGMGGSRRRRRGFAPVAFSPTQLFASGEQGVWYDPSDLTAEKVSWRRNLLTYSEALNDAVWTKNGTQITADDTTAPDGTLTADRVNPNVTNAIAIVHSGSVTIDNLNRTGSVYLKYGNWQYMTVCLQRFNDTSGWVAITVDLVNGTITKTGNGATATYVSSAITAAANGFYRVELTGIGATSTGCALEVSFAPSGNPTYGVYGRTNVTGTASNYTHVWGAQLEIASAATAYQRITNFSNDFLAAFPNTALFQNSTGTTPVTALGQPVGLVLDKSRWDGRGVVNYLPFSDQFDNGAWLKLNANVLQNSETAPDGTLTADKLRELATTAIHYTSQNLPAFSGIITLTTSVYAKKAEREWLKVFLWNGSNSIGAYFNVDTGTVGTVDAGITAAISNVGNGWFRCSVTRTSTFGNTSGPGFIVALSDNVQSYAGVLNNGLFLWGAQLELGSTATAYQANGASVGGPGNHARQTTDAARPTLQARSNLLTRTEEFNDAAWTKTGLNAFGSGSVANTLATTDPLSGNTADYIQENTAGGTGHVVSQAITVVSGAVYTHSCYIKAAQRTIGVLRIAGTPNLNAFFNLSNGTIGTVDAGLTANISNAGNGWYRCSITWTSTVTGSQSFVIGMSSADGTLAYTGDGTSGIYLWGAQLELANAVSAYQRVTTATDYADIGLPRALQFDGTDDFLVTAANLNMTASDEVTVAAGVFKGSDAAASNIAELSADVNTNDRSWRLYASTLNVTRNTYEVLSKGNIVVFVVPTGYAAPITNVVTGLAKIQADSVVLRVNGIQAASSSADQGTGNAYGSYLFYIGRRGGATLSFNGRIHQLIVRGALTSGAQLTSTEQWVAQKTGVTLP